MYFLSPLFEVQGLQRKLPGGSQCQAGKEAELRAQDKVTAGEVSRQCASQMPVKGDLHYLHQAFSNVEYHHKQHIAGSGKKIMLEHSVLSGHLVHVLHTHRLQLTLS